MCLCVFIYANMSAMLVGGGQKGVLHLLDLETQLAVSCLIEVLCKVSVQP